MKATVNHKYKELSLYGSKEELDNLTENMKTKINNYTSTGYCVIEHIGGSGDIKQMIKQLIMNHV